MGRRSALPDCVALRSWLLAPFRIVQTSVIGAAAIKPKVTEYTSGHDLSCKFLMFTTNNLAELSASCAVAARDVTGACWPSVDFLTHVNFLRG